MSKKIYFHANASRIEGSGHLMRLYALAEEAKSRDIHTIFVGKISDVSWITDDLMSNVFDEVLDVDSVLSQDTVGGILIWDSYKIYGNTQRVLSLPFAAKYLLADTTTPTQIADGVFLLEDSLLWKTFLTNFKIPYIAGRDLMPIRKSHRVGSDFMLSVDSDFLTVLIYSGGIDFKSFVSSVSSYIIQNFKNVRVVAISNSETMIKDKRLVKLKATPYIDMILDRMDVVIASASTSIFEVLARRIPSGFVATAYNQESNRKYLLAENLSFEIGAYIDNKFKIYDESINRLLSDATARQLAQENCYRLIDGLGSSRIIEKVLLGFRPL